jgi:hypothetical protein
MRYLIFSLIGLLALLLGCQQQEAPMEQSQLTSDQTTSLLKPPANSGPNIVRWESSFGWLFYDMANDLISIHSWDDVVCSPGRTDFVLLQIQDIYNPSDQNLLMTLMKSKGHWIFVFDWTGLTGADINCEVLMENLFAVGRGNLVSTDNDLFAWMEHDRNRANSFKTTGQGKVFDSAGAEYHYNLVSKYVWKMGTELDHGFDKINLKKKGK